MTRNLPLIAVLAAILLSNPLEAEDEAPKPALKKLSDLKDREYVFTITHKDDQPTKAEKSRRFPSRHALDRAFIS